jgi:hypothetical protein
MAELSLEEGLKTLTRRTKAAEVIIYAFFAFSIAVFFGALLELAGVIDLSSDYPDDLATAFALAYLGYGLVMLASVVIIAMWIYRAHANLRATGAETEFTPGWAVGWYFVPIASLFKPFQAMRELVNGSHLQTNDFGGEAPGEIKIWWGCFLIGGFLGNASTRINLAAETANPVASALDALSTVILVASAWYLLKIIREVDAAQRHEMSAAEVFA